MLKNLKKLYNKFISMIVERVSVEKTKQSIYKDMKNDYNKLCS